MNDGLFDGRFDQELAYEMFAMYKSGRIEAMPDELIRQAGSLIRGVIATEFASADDHKKDELSMNALEHVFLVLSRKEFVGDAKSFYSFLWVTIRNSMLDTLRRLAAQRAAPDADTTDLVYGRPELTHDDIERFIFVNQFRQLVFNLFKADARFRGDEWEVCCLLAASTLGYISLDDEVINLKYNIPKERFRLLAEYTRIHLRQSLCAARQMVEK